MITRRSQVCSIIAALLSVATPTSLALSTDHGTVRGADHQKRQRRRMQQVNWDALSSTLSSPGVLQPGDVSAYASECVAPFEAEGYPYPETLSSPYPQNVVDMINAPHGMCTTYLSCAYDRCEWPFDPVSAVDMGALETEALNLPEAVVIARTVGDVVQAVRFADDNDLMVTVKATGNNLVGSNTNKGSILVNLSQYPRYAATSIFECPANPQGGTAYTDSDEGQASLCELARAKGKGAMIRVSGGERWAETLGAIHDYNEAAAADGRPEYHVVSGIAATVGSAGGWLAGGGLGGMGGMRMFGLGVDQVLQYEMVLPDGTHIKLGPSAWVDEDGYDYPRTTQVSGMCNQQNPVTGDESQWDWAPCTVVDFQDLWYGLRGGGGGAFGVVTAVHYQLNDKPGTLQTISQGYITPDVGAQMLAACTAAGNCETLIRAMRLLWINFLTDFFFDPSSLSVTETDSNRCGSSGGETSMDFWDSRGLTNCYSGAGDVFVSSWREQVAGQEEALRGMGLDDALITALAEAVYVQGEYDDLFSTLIAPEPQPRPCPFFATDCPEGGELPPPRDIAPGRHFFAPRMLPYAMENPMNALYPMEWVLGNREESTPLLLSYPEAGLGTIVYFMGGRIPTSHDQMSSIPQTERDSSYLMQTFTENRTTWFLTSIFGGADMTGDYPGGTEYNHIGVNELGPLREDWTKTCDMSWSWEERNDRCISMQEAVWGTVGLSRLLAAKGRVDPRSRFLCPYCLVEPDNIRSSGGSTGTPSAPGGSDAPFIPGEADPPASTSMSYSYANGGSGSQMSYDYSSD